MIGLNDVLPKVASFDESSYILLLDDVKQQASLTHNKLQFDISQRSCTIIEYDEKTIILHLIIYEFFSFESDDDSRLTLKNK